MGPELGIALAIGGAALNFSQAQAQNKATARSMRQARESASVQQEQLSRQASLELRRNQIRAQQVRGRLRVALGEAGVGMGGSAQALLNQSEYDEGINRSIIEESFLNNDARVRSGLNADMIGLESRVQNSLLSALSGGLSGFSTGLSIAGAADTYNALNQANNVPAPIDPNRILPPTV